jgi:hypothetical protein
MKRVDPNDRAIIEGMIKEGDSSPKDIAAAVGGRVKLGTISYIKHQIIHRGPGYRGKNGKTEPAASSKPSPRAAVPPVAGGGGLSSAIRALREEESALSRRAEELREMISKLESLDKGTGQHNGAK